jgi:hypothetical protein
MVINKIYVIFIELMEGENSPRKGTDQSSISTFLIEVKGRIIEQGILDK